MGVLLVLSGLVGAVLAVWVLIVGHLRWARIRSRKGSAILAVGALALFVAGGALSDPGSPSTRAPRAAAAPVASSVRRSAPAAQRPTAIAVAVQPATIATRRPSARATPQAPTAPRTAPAPTATPTRPATGQAAVALLGLAVKGRAPKTGYSREQFGPAWADVAHDGCDTRNDILRRDLTAITVRAGTGGCEVLTGSLADPYSGSTITFARGIDTSAQVQIDHVVPLSNAWQTGAARWTATIREDFANDPLNLLAVDGSLNEQKSDGDAATWLPPNKAERCAYVARQVAVKARYRLWVTPPEKAAIARVLAGCPGQLLPSEAGTTPPPPDPAPDIKMTGAGSASPSPKPAATATATAQPAGLDPRFATCRAAIAAGYGPYREGIDPEYFWYRDADHDGIDCER